MESWTPDQLAEYLFTVGVEKQHCEVFRDQEITGEVVLGMDQSSLFIKAFDLGSVGRRLKTWHKIKALQDEVKGEGPGTRRTTQTYGSEVGSDDARRTRSRTNTLTNSVHRLPTGDGRPSSIQNKRLSLTQTPRMDPAPGLVSPVSPATLADSPTRPVHTKRPSAASVRDLHHSRRHSSTDFRLTGTTMTGAPTPKLATSGTFPMAAADGSHKKQPSFDKNWTMGSAAHTPRPLSSTGFQEIVQASDPDLQDSAVDLERGYFSSTDADGKRRNVLKKHTAAHSRQSSYAEEQRVRSATAISRHSRYGSVDSVRAAVSPAVQKYFGISDAAHRRTASTNTTESIRPIPPAKDVPPPTVTRLDGTRSTSESPASLGRPSQMNRHGIHADWLAAVANKAHSVRGAAGGPGLRAISDNLHHHHQGLSDRTRVLSPTDSSAKDSPMQSPARTGSSTPSAGPSFELDSPDAAKSPSSVTTPASRTSASGGRKKGKKETSAYTRGLQRVPPKEAIAAADYSGWMKKKSSNLMTTWKPRLFVLKGRRLAYYYSEDDESEKGLIDISFHRVLPADNERLTGLHATLTGAGSTPTVPGGATIATSEAGAPPLAKGDDSMFIFKLMPPRTGLSRAVNFTKPTVHYFAVPNLQQGRLWMAALMKATIDRDDAQPITTTYQQKTISLAKARAMRHRPPALMNLDEGVEEAGVQGKGGAATTTAAAAIGPLSAGDTSGLGISFGEADSGVAGLEKLGLQRVESGTSASARQAPAGLGLGFGVDAEKGGVLPPQSA